MKLQPLSLALVVPAMLKLASLSASASFSYNDFSSTAGLQLNGSAAQAGNVLRVVPSQFGSGGSAFTTAAVPLGNLASFSTYFQFQISNNNPLGIGDGDGLGADGFVFTIQTVSNNVGGVGGGLGYLGINNSVGIEFDTFDNGVGVGDPDGNHVGIDLNGSVASTVTASEPTRFNDGSVWNAWVDYNGNSGDLEVRWSQSNVRPVAAQLASNVNLPAILGQNTAFLGFTAGTGAGASDHDILQWQYVDSFNPINPTVPEPSSALFALALIGTALNGRARRS